jgi:hypothetical protein
LDQNGAKINIHVAALLVLIVIFFAENNMGHWLELLNFFLFKSWRNAGYFYARSSKNSGLSSSYDLA